MRNSNWLIAACATVLSTAASVVTAWAGAQVRVRDSHEGSDQRKNWIVPACFRRALAVVIACNTGDNRPYDG